MNANEILELLDGQTVPDVDHRIAVDLLRAHPDSHEILVRHVGSNSPTTDHAKAALYEYLRKSVTQKGFVQRNTGNYLELLRQAKRLSYMEAGEALYSTLLGDIGTHSEKIRRLFSDVLPPRGTEENRRLFEVKKGVSILLHDSARNEHEMKNSLRAVHEFLKA